MQSVDSPYVLSLTGSLTTPRAEAIHSEVLAALSGHSSVTIDCSNASEMDVAFIQILVAANRFASQCGKTVALASPPAGSARRDLESLRLFRAEAADGRRWPKSCPYPRREPDENDPRGG